MNGLKVGVLALQGDFALHGRVLSGLGHDVVEVRSVGDLGGLEGLVLPGGESTTIAMGIEREGLAAPIAELAAGGVPVFGTCAGMVLLGKEHLGLLDIEVERNAFGRQVRSFETDLVVSGIEGNPVRALFIRAPAVSNVGAGVSVLAEVDGRPVAVRSGNVTAIAFHPELIGETRLHAFALSGGSGPGHGMAPEAGQSVLS